jgi:hypothetical protein
LRRRPVDLHGDGGEVVDQRMRDVGSPHEAQELAGDLEAAPQLQAAV